MQEKDQHTQPLPDLRKGCLPRNFKHVEIYVSRNSPKFNEEKMKMNYTINTMNVVRKALGWCSYAVYIFMLTHSGPPLIS